jgi:ACR3 family arsenite efflux pump ArsB
MTAGIPATRASPGGRPTRSRAHGNLPGVARGGPGTGRPVTRETHARISALARCPPARPGARRRTDRLPGAAPGRHTGQAAAAAARPRWQTLAAHPVQAAWPVTSRVSLSRAAVALEHRLLVFVLAAAAVGLAVQGPGRFADSHAGTLVALAVLVLAAGISVQADGLRGLGGALGRIMLIAAVSTVALPALAWLAGRLVADPVLRDGVLAAGLAPAEVASVGLAALAGTDTALAALLLIISAAATVALAGPLLSLLAGTTASAGSAGLLATLALVVALPLAAGIVARARWPHAAPLRTAAPMAGNVALLVLIYLVAAQIPHSTAYLPVIPALLAFLAGSALLGWILARLVSPDRRPAVLLPIAMRDFAIAAGIADTAFSHRAAAPLGAYGILVLLFGTIASRRATAPATSP